VDWLVGQHLLWRSL